tara:strand:- start:695 stop:1129 length:435 start_codon:yes stop_codon:yes gene_type:complete
MKTVTKSQADKILVKKMTTTTTRRTIDLENASEIYQFLKDTKPEELGEYVFQLAIDGHHGIYCGQIFAKNFVQANISENYWRILKDGPENNEEYWEAWEHTADHWETDDGYCLHLGESGDVFCYKSLVVRMIEDIKDINFWEEC